MAVCWSLLSHLYVIWEFIAFIGTFICNSRLNSCSANYQIFILFFSDVFIIYCTVYEIFILIFKRRGIHYLHCLELPFDISKMITQGWKSLKDASQVCRQPHGGSVPEENTWQENYAIKADAWDHPALLGALSSLPLSLPVSIGRRGIWNSSSQCLSLSSQGSRCLYRAGSTSSVSLGYGTSPNCRRKMQ